MTTPLRGRLVDDGRVTVIVVSFDDLAWSRVPEPLCPGTTVLFSLGPGDVRRYHILTTMALYGEQRLLVLAHPLATGLAPVPTDAPIRAMRFPDA